MQKDDNYFMNIAIKEALKAKEQDEVPIGAVIVKDGKVLSKAYNNRNTTQNAINHAEVLAIAKACKKQKSWRLENCKIYVTLEPCPMCIGAILNARINEVIFGAKDKTGLCDLITIITNDSRLNHKANVKNGVLEDKCSSLITDFFKSKRG